MGIVLNKEQQLAVEMYIDFYKYPGRRKRPWFEVDGPAGSGKTTIVRETMNYLGIDQDEAAFMAFVGKATLALRRTGLNAKTIHSIIYNLVLTYAKGPVEDVVLSNNGRKLVHSFEKKEKLDIDYKQFIVDEGGMVGERMAVDLLSFDVPTWVLGDLAQLPPVMDKRYFLKEPDISLKSIMRQAEGSPIIYLSQRVKNRQKIEYGTYGNNECNVIRRKDLTDDMMKEADIVICETNNTRDYLNTYIRENIHHIHSPQITIGDKLICRQNKWHMKLNDDIAMVNGLIGYVENVYKESRTKSCLMDIDLRPEFLEKEQFDRVNIRYDYPFLPYANRMEINPMTQHNLLMEFAYAITCHLAQGSQYDNVLVYVERPSNSLYFRQWLYTAITRAREKLTIVVP